MFFLMPKKNKKSSSSAPVRRKRGKPVLHPSEHNYRALIQHSPDVIANVDRHGKILFINRTLPEYTVESVIGTDITYYHTPEDASRFQQRLEKLFDSGEPQSLELDAVGPTRWLARIFPIHLDGKIESALVIATDITEQKRTERALLSSNDLNRRMMEAVSAGIVQVAADGAICMANEHAQRILGLRFDELKNLYVTHFETKTI